MLLAVDIGNTNISFGLFYGKKLLKKASVSSGNYTLPDIKRKLGRAVIDDIVVCSVVPKLTLKIAGDLKKIFKQKVRIIGKDIFVPIKNLYRIPGHVGQDRLVNACAGVAFYGAPLIIVDFGTAITFDIVSKKGEYVGGIIAPGIEISLDALSQRAALLRKITPERPKVLVGRDTESSMNSGIVYGMSFLVNGLLKKLRHEFFKQKVNVIATGGCAKFLSSYCFPIDKVDSYLTLKGIQLISIL